MTARFRIGEELASFLTAGQSVVIATRSPALRPHATRACGLRVIGDDRIALLLPDATSAQAFADLRDNGEVAISVCRPPDYHTIKLKGRLVGERPSTSEDVVVSQQQLYAFAEACATFGLPRQNIRNLWLFEGSCVEIQILSVFRQTPGPGAGTPL